MLEYGYLMKQVTDESFTIKSALESLLADVPFCTLEQPRTGSGNLPARGCADAMAQVQLPNGKRVTLTIEECPSGQPRSVRMAINNLLLLRQQYPKAYPIVVAPYISPESAEIICREGVGYLDQAGNARLTFGHVYIRRDGYPNRHVKRRDLRSLYSPKAERVLRSLLLEPKRLWRLETLAKTAGVSLGQASNVKRLLEDREWLARDAAGLVLKQPQKLLDEWAANHRFTRNAVHDYYSLDPMPQSEANLAAACSRLEARYAFTGFSSAARLAPMVRYQRATAYVVGAEGVAESIGFKAVSSGANISLIEPNDEGVLAGATEIDGIRITSAVQTYLDLRSLKGRGEEAAQAVLEEVIRPTW
jgi:hypothetical protein